MSVQPTQERISSTEAFVIVGGAAGGAFIAYKMGVKDPALLVCVAVASAVIADIVYRAARKNGVATHCYNLDADCFTSLVQTFIDALPEAASVGAACGSGNITECLAKGFGALKKDR